MKLSKKIIQILTITSILSLFPLNTFAASGDITIDPTFTYDQDGLWQPGRGEVKEFNITNHKDEDVLIDRLFIELTKAINWRIDKVLDIDSVEFSELAQGSIFKLIYDGAILYEAPLQKLVEEQVIVIPRGILIKSGQKQLFEMEISMDESIGNDAQALHKAFTIGVGFKRDLDSIIPPVDPPTEPENPTGPTKPIKPIKPVNPETGGVTDKLPQTGGIINSASLIALGTVAIGTGIVLNKKSENKGGGKHNE